MAKASKQRPILSETTVPDTAAAYERADPKTHSPQQTLDMPPTRKPKQADKLAQNRAPDCNMSPESNDAATSVKNVKQSTESPPNDNHPDRQD